MTGIEFEVLASKLLNNEGFWCIKIPRNESGAQPFDILAIRGNVVLALDCKVCSHGLFPISRVEDNQWLSFEKVSKRTNAVIGILAYYEQSLYLLPYRDLKKARDTGKASIKLDDSNFLFKVRL